MAIEILHRDDLPLGGFAGLKEYRIVMSPKLFGKHVNVGTWPGIGGFVYLADARFDPKGETKMHDHKEIDVISVMLEGRIEHQGSLEHGQMLDPGSVQVQRAGGEGFSHNEINPEKSRNRMLQLWVLPEKRGERSDYRLYNLQSGKTIRVYGGRNDQKGTIVSHTVIDIASLDASGELVLEKPFLIYFAAGKGTSKNLDLKEGDLLRGDQLDFLAGTDAILIIIYEI